MEAPVICFEGAPNLGVHQGVGRVTLEMLIFDPTAETDAPKAHRKIVAQLRGPLWAFGASRAAIDQMELAAPTQGGETEAPGTALLEVVAEPAPDLADIPWRGRCNLIAAAGVSLLDILERA
jgi:hypothetical protein